MAYEFYVVMQKRSDGKVYADLHKTDERMYLLEEDADASLVAMGDLAKHFHKVKIVGVLADEWYNAQEHQKPERSVGDIVPPVVAIQRYGGKTMKFRKKPVVIEALRYDGPESHNLVRLFVGNARPLHQLGDGKLGIETLEDVMEVTPGDWIIKGVKGEFYPCKPDIFAATYEPADDIANQC